MDSLSSSAVNALLDHIRRNLDSKIRIPDLAGEVFLSPFYFARVFRRTFGLSPHKFVMSKRVERAKVLMVQSDLPLGIIAVECGMADQAHFNRVFRRFVGDSPGAWRRAQVNREPRPGR